jgi:hypothetical protein
MERDHKRTNGIIACACLGGACLRNFTVEANMFCIACVCSVAK